MAIRYYERRGLLAADVAPAGVNWEAGLALEEIAGYLDAPTVAEWKR